MNFPNFFNPVHSLKLFELKDNFNFLYSLYVRKKLPKVLMLSGPKGSGKSTLVNHLLFSIFEKNGYDKENQQLQANSNFYNQFRNGIFSSTIYLKGEDFKSIKIDDIRSLKSKIFKSTILNKERFIILDDVELFSINSLNALLKIIEEPDNNNFILINNNSKPIIDTIKSRALEIKIILKESDRLNIIQKLISLYNLDEVLDRKNSELTPGNFLKFNYICKEYKINPTINLVDNFSTLLSLFKKNKDFDLMNIIFYVTDQYFKNLKNRNIVENEKIFELRNYVLKNLNYFLLYNINQNTLINQLASKFNRG